MPLSGEIDLETRGDVTWGGASRRVTGAVSDKHPSFSQPLANGQIVIAVYDALFSFSVQLFSC